MREYFKCKFTQPTPETGYLQPAARFEDGDEIQAVFACATGKLGVLAKFSLLATPAKWFSFAPIPGDGSVNQNMWIVQNDNLPTGGSFVDLGNVGNVLSVRFGVDLARNIYEMTPWAFRPKN